jgi:hypothetical protein
VADVEPLVLRHGETRALMGRGWVPFVGQQWSSARSRSLRRDLRAVGTRRGAAGRRRSRASRCSSANARGAKEGRRRRRRSPVGGIGAATVTAAIRQGRGVMPGPCRDATRPTSSHTSSRSRPRDTEIDSRRRSRPESFACPRETFVIARDATDHVDVVRSLSHEGKAGRGGAPIARAESRVGEAFVEGTPH